MTSILEAWRALYDVGRLHISLMVGDTNHCAHLVSTELYTAYSHIAKQDTVSVDTKVQVLKFDLYQNSIASAVSYVMSKLQWSALTAPQRSEDRSKCVKKLLNLLAWQLARFWDGTKKVGFIEQVAG